MNFYNKNYALNNIKSSFIFALIVLLFLCGCGSSSDDSTDLGQIKFYNASSNAPAVYLTIDEDIETSDDEEIEITFSAVAYGDALNSTEVVANSYFYELAWQDGESSERDELTLLVEGNLQVTTESTQLVTLSGDVQNPIVNVFAIAEIDESDDDTYDRFNLNLVNLSSHEQAVDVYVSDDDETFNEAVLIHSSAANTLSDNIKLDQGNYIVYLVESGDDTPVFQSSAIPFLYSAQYVIAIRDNAGAGSSPYAIDKLSSTSVTNYADVNAQAAYRIYNGIAEQDLLDNYQGSIDVDAHGETSDKVITALDYKDVSASIVVTSGDYSLDVVDSETGEYLQRNHLLSLPQNINKTVFLYSDEVAQDPDGDGNVDEDGDGIVDEYKVNIHSLAIEDSVTASIYDHTLTPINLVDSEDFSSITVYFVKSDEISTLR